MSAEDIKQWLDVLKSGGDAALIIGIWYGWKIISQISRILVMFEEMHTDIKLIKRSLYGAPILAEDHERHYYYDQRRD
jgi:hypothetical protein